MSCPFTLPERSEGIDSADRLAPNPKRASDGGDIGVRYTQEMLRLAHELRRKRVIKS